MKKIISFLGLFVTVVLLASLNPNSANAETWTHTYSYDNIPNRTITYDFISNHNNFLDLTIDDTTYHITSEYKVMDACCDKFGTVWADLSNDNNLFYLGFYNFELQGNENPVFHPIRTGIVISSDVEVIALYGHNAPNTYWTLPSVEDLSNYLSTGEITLNYIPDPNSVPTPTPVPVTEEPAKPTSPTLTETPAPTEPISTEKPAPIATIPAPTQLPLPTTPISAPTSKPIPTASATVDSNTTPATVGKPASVVKKGSTISLVDSSGNVIKTITLKAGKLTVNKRVVKNVKSSYFTKKGTVVYLTKSGKAYYINSKNKPKLIKAKVKQLKTSKGFAINLKLKNGKTVKIRV